MIGYIEGKIVDINQEKIIVLTGNGIGFEVYCDTSGRIDNEDVKLYIQTVVRENDISLYGFSDKNSKQLFNTLITVNGIGPKAAINIMRNIKPEEFISCIVNKDVNKLSTLKGLGKKSAEKIVFSLKDKFDKDRTEMKLTGFDQKSNDVIQALIFLGYEEKESNSVVNEIYDKTKGVDELIKTAILKMKNR